MADTNKIGCEVGRRRWNCLGQERGCERLFCGIGVDTRMSKGERETKDQLERDC